MLFDIVNGRDAWAAFVVAARAVGVPCPWHGAPCVARDLGGRVAARCGARPGTAALKPESLILAQNERWRQA